MRKINILIILILCLFLSACQGKNIKLTKTVEDLSIDSFKLGEYLTDYQEFFVSEFTEIIDNQNKRVYLQTILSDNDTKKQVDVSLNDGNKVLKVNSVNNEIKSAEGNFMNLKQLIKVLDNCYYFKSNTLNGKRIVVEILTAPVGIEFADLKNVYLIESSGLITQYKEKTFDGYIVRIISGDELYHLCLNTI